MRDGKGCSTFTTTLASLQYAAPTGPSHLGKGCSSTVGEQEPDSKRTRAGSTKICSTIHDGSQYNTYFPLKDALKLPCKVLCKHGSWCARVNHLCADLMYITPKAWESMAVILC